MCRRLEAPQFGAKPGLSSWGAGSGLYADEGTCILLPHFLRVQLGVLYRWGQQTPSG